MAPDTHRFGRVRIKPLAHSLEIRVRCILHDVEIYVARRIRHLLTQENLSQSLATQRG